MLITTLCGYAAAILFVALIVWRHYRDTVPIGFADVGIIATAYLTASNIPNAVVLCVCGLTPDPLLDATMLHGYEKFIGLAGLTLLLTLALSLRTLVLKAMGR